MIVENYSSFCENAENMLGVVMRVAPTANGCLPVTGSGSHGNVAAHLVMADHIKHELTQQQQMAVEQQIAASQVYGKVEEAEIEKFLQEHPPTTDDATRRDIKVAELRRIIPLLIIRQFNIRKDPTQKKGRCPKVNFAGSSM